MSWLSSFFSPKKSNLTPDTPMPTQEQLYFTGQPASDRGYSLRDFAARGIRGEGLGFGDQFVDRASSAPIKSMDTRFRERTLPFMNSQLSGRGIARSSLATDQLGKAFSENERNVNDLLSQFYVLNETQKKSDQTQALNLAQNLQGQEAGMKTNEAKASADLANATAAQQNQRQAGNQTNLMQALQVGGQALNSFGPDIQGMLGKLGIGGQQQGVGGSSALASFGVNPVRTRTIDSYGLDELEGMDLNSLLQLYSKGY